MMKKIKNMTPQEIVNELDKYIIGQADAKRNVAIALRNRWRRMNVEDEIKNEIIPNNILMIGATGVGKTEIARRLAKLSDAPFTKVEASKFTEVGYVGRDVESMVRDLVEQSVNLVKLIKKEEVKLKAEESVNNLILDILIPPINKVQSNINLSLEKNRNNEDKEINEKTREKFKEKINSGELDDRKIEITVQKPSNSGIGMVGGGMMDESSMINLQDMISNMMPKRNKKRKVSIGEAKKILLEAEVSKLIDMDEVKDEAIQKAENTGIIFIDEIDKISGNSKKSGGPDVSREGVQRDLLPIVEGTSVTTKYGVIKTDHILFVAAGAFHLSKPSDLIPELQGRFPIRVELDNLTQEDFLKILSEPKNSLTKQYTALIKSEDVEIIFNKDALEEISNKAFIINSEIENIGARRLHTVMSKLLNEILFDIPEKIGPNAKVVITKKMVQEKLDSITQNKDLSEYIL
ncbi:MAG: ATP-dependent protease ATPase subunit HslU [Bacteroidota bacterium]|nr:ATP-dependent protease ATPase subunit HslU [Bacteroidota bacterium]MEC7851298.1 ATP-dependent protease ATPase subunit HslU [Bacteroidota bacterium]MEC8679438.1 ATP-dependent protease ATPase subunit HslU [Bacteroidota bacterium]MEC8702032.1 ATP-dependent protease ATPase subunit HslU [Bacteroidota bacterium]